MRDDLMTAARDFAGKLWPRRSEMLVGDSHLLNQRLKWTAEIAILSAFFFNIPRVRISEINIRGVRDE